MSWLEMGEMALALQRGFVIYPTSYQGIVNYYSIICNNPLISLVLASRENNIQNNPYLLPELGSI